jgi:hypothetical protein
MVKIRRGPGFQGISGLDARPLDAQAKGVEPDPAAKLEIFPVAVPKIRGSSGARGHSRHFVRRPVVLRLPGPVKPPFTLVAGCGNPDQEAWRGHAILYGSRISRVDHADKFSVFSFQWFSLRESSLSEN